MPRADRASHAVRRGVEFHRAARRAGHGHRGRRLPASVHGPVATAKGLERRAPPGACNTRCLPVLRSVPAALAADAGISGAPVRSAKLGRFGSLGAPRGRSENGPQHFRVPGPRGAEPGFSKGGLPPGRCRCMEVRGSDSCGYAGCQSAPGSRLPPRSSSRSRLFP